MHRCIPAAEGKISASLSVRISYHFLFPINTRVAFCHPTRSFVRPRACSVDQISINVGPWGCLLSLLIRNVIDMNGPLSSSLSVSPLSIIQEGGFFVFAFINQHSAAASRSLPPSISLSFQRSRLSDSRYPLARVASQYE